MGWGSEFSSLLNGEESVIRTPGDISLVLGVEQDYWHPSQVREVDRAETIEREKIGDMNKDISVAWENYFADLFQSEKVDRGPMDVRPTLTPVAHNWPVQVKTCNYYRKAGEGVRKGSFTFREHEYGDMDEKSLFQFYVNQTFFDDEHDFEGETLEVVKEDTGRTAYVENLGQMLVPKHLLEAYFEPKWTSSGYWNLKWDKVFGNMPVESPVFGFTSENYADITGSDNYELTDFGGRTVAGIEEFNH